MLVTEHEAADYLGLSVHTLRAWRSQARGPVYRRIGRRSIRYHIADLDTYLADGAVTPIAETTHH